MAEAVITAAEVLEAAEAAEVHTDPRPDSVEAALSEAHARVAHIIIIIHMAGDIIIHMFMRRVADTEGHTGATPEE